ncbi:MAG: hypothetical protein RR623_08070 [Bacilli bacterium]
MVDINKVKVLLLEDTYPFFTDAQLKTMCEIYTDINELCYIACMQKAQDEGITIGPITVKSNAVMWRNLGRTFQKKYLASRSNSGNKTGCVGRADEY